MSSVLKPEPGTWYKKDDDGDSFEVLFVDPDDGDVEICYFDGTVAMIDLSSWHELPLRRREPPQALATVDPAALAHTERTIATERRWTGPLDWTGSDD